MKYGTLFSGIGGDALGLDRAGHVPVWHSEIADYPSRVLARHWPHVPNVGDITTTDWSSVEHADIIAGGYPCPAFSYAARGRNVAPDLWRHMRDVIEVVEPTYVILENVAAHLRRGFAAVLADLADLGFDAEWEVVTACAFGAPHPRRRLFALAYANRDRQPVRPVDGEVALLSPPTGHRRHRWLPTPDDVGADHGVPDRLDRLRALGNAVVPDIAEWLGESINTHAAALEAQATS